jgi:hypothetical protein
MCFECYRAERNRRRAEPLAEAPAMAPLRSPFPAQLTPRQLAHRRLMLTHLPR